MRTMRPPKTFFSCSRCDHAYRSRDGDRSFAAAMARLNGWEIGDGVLCPGCASVGAVMT